MSATTQSNTDTASEPTGEAPELSATCYTINGDDGVEIQTRVTVSSSDYPQDVLHSLAELGRVTATERALNGTLKSLTAIAAGDNEGATQFVFSSNTTTDHLGVQLVIESTATFQEGPVLGGGRLQSVLNDVHTHTFGELVDAVDSLAEQKAENERLATQESLVAPMKEYLARLNDIGNEILDTVPPGLDPEDWQRFAVNYTGADCGGNCSLCRATFLEALSTYGDVESLTSRGIPQEAAEAIIANPTLQYIRNNGKGSEDDLESLPADVADLVREHRAAGASVRVTRDPSGMGGRVIVAYPMGDPSGSPDDPLASFGIIGLDSLGDVPGMYDIGVPRPSSSSPLGALFSVLGGRRRRNGRPA
jgi:hypothetical protein